MLKRTSNVDAIHIDIVSFASIVQLGDSCLINGHSRALAVQREEEVFYGNEGNFSSYPIFREHIPLQPINESYSFLQHNPNPFIKVKKLDIIGVSSASIIHVGNSQNVSMETRIKHIRQLLPEKHDQDT